MTAVIAEASTQSERRAFRNDVQVPKVDSGKVLIRVRAAAINPVDYKLPLFVVRGNGVGLDVAGEVEEVGEDVTEFKKGDAVFGFTRGSLADYALCSATKIAKKPAGMTFVEAASLPTAHLTSYQSLVRNGFKKGHKVLIVGASGGCGLAAVQLAKALGAGEIIGVCSGRNEKMVLGEGATGIVDYTKEAYEKVYDEGYFDMVYDCATGSGAGEQYYTANQQVLKEGGMQVAINGGATTWISKFLRWESNNFRLMVTDQNTKDLAAVAEVLQSSGRGPVIDSVFPFTAEKVEAAFKKLKSRRARGKIVVEMGEKVEEENEDEKEAEDQASEGSQRVEEDAKEAMSA